MNPLDLVPSDLNSDDLRAVIEGADDHLDRLLAPRAETCVMGRVLSLYGAPAYRVMRGDVSVDVLWIGLTGDVVLLSFDDPGRAVESLQIDTR